MASSEAQFYTYEALDIDENNVSMAKYRGKLQELYTRYSSQGLCILAFPCNQFKNQEPGNNAEIKENVRNNFGVTFDLFCKIDVNGSTAHPLFLYLQEALRGTLTNKIKWNFTKFLIDRNGNPQKRYAPTTDPLSFEDDIKELL
nr:glutathione peroxidase [Hymenolepis microstoma]